VTATIPANTTDQLSRNPEHTESSECGSGRTQGHTTWREARLEVASAGDAPCLKRTTQSGKLSGKRGCRLLITRQAGHRTRPELLVCGGAPRRNRTGDPILTIDARVVHDALRHLASPHNRAGGKALPRVGTWGSVRMRVAQFLANLWHARALGGVGERSRLRLEHRLIHPVLAVWSLRATDGARLLG
jgi:hypothetical protein